MFKKLKRGMMAVSHQIMSVKRQKLYKKEINGNSEVESTLSRIKNLLKELSSRYELTEESVNLKIDQQICNIKHTEKKTRKK